MVDISEIGLFVKERRKANKLTQKDLSELSQVSRNSISLLENGSDKVRLYAVFRILNVFGKNLELKCIEAKRNLGKIPKTNLFKKQNGKKVLVEMGDEND